MQRKLARLLAFTLCMALCPAAFATWGSFISAGTSGVGVPSCAQVSSGLVACAVRSNAAGMMVKLHQQRFRQRHLRSDGDQRQPAGDHF
jgi:TRAP-type C4-dicarboxylate transport system permease small subunit